MVPSLFVLVAALPLLPSGKVDRRELAQRDLSGLQGPKEWVAARTPYEELVVQVWEALLGRERIGVDDNFFELGGHSLLATQVATRLQQMFNLDIPLRALFENPTAAELARYVEEMRLAGRHTSAPPIVAVPRDRDLPLSFAQERLWFLDQLAQGGSLYNLPYPIRLRGELNAAALELTLGEVIRRHEVLRTSFPTVDGRPVQRFTAAVPLVQPVIDLSGLEEEARETERHRLVEADAERPFDLARGPLLQTALLRLNEADHLMLFTMHHIVSDGWSMGVLVREVSALYSAFCAGRPSPLPELPVQYADFAVWQRQYLQGEVLEAQLDYWKQRLGGRNLPFLDLPTDRPRRPAQTYRGWVELQTFPAGLHSKLELLSQQNNATLFMTLLAAFITLLHRITGNDDIIIGTALAGRNRAEIQGLIGFFINMLPIRGDLSQNPSFLQLLARTREAALGAFTYQDIPLEKLIQEIQPERFGSQTPLFQVAFGFRHEIQEQLDLSGLKLEPVPLAHNFVRLDLSLWVTERAGTLAANWFYNTDLFEAATIRRLADRYATLLGNLAEAPETLVNAVEIYSEAEKRAIAEEQARKEDAEARSLKSSRRKAVSLSGH
jgi:non-ribosomal peptide synthetase component F